MNPAISIDSLFLLQTYLPLYCFLGFPIVHVQQQCFVAMKGLLWVQMAGLPHSATGKNNLDLTPRLHNIVFLFHVKWCTSAESSVSLNGKLTKNWQWFLSLLKSNQYNTIKLMENKTKAMNFSIKTITSLYGQQIPIKSHFQSEVNFMPLKCYPDYKASGDFIFGICRVCFGTGIFLRVLC